MANPQVTGQLEREIETHRVDKNKEQNFINKSTEVIKNKKVQKSQLRI